MSFGKQSSSSKQQSTTTQALDPDIKAALLGNYNQFVNTFPTYQPYTGTDVADFSPEQLKAFSMVGDIAKNQTGASTLQSGIDAAKAIGGYTPMSISANPASAGLIDRSTIPTLSAQNVGDMDLSKYLNPYTNDVVDATTNNALNSIALTRNQNASDATKLGAWRGNALSVENGVTDSQTLIGLAQTIANLRAAGYTQAQATAAADADRNLQAQQGNLGAALTVGQTNAGNTTETNLANMGAALSAAQSNQSAQQAAEALKLSGAQTLASMGEQQLTDAATRASLEEQVGSQKQAQQQALLDWAYQNNYLNPQQYAFAVQQLRNQTLGLAGDPTLTQSQSKGSSKSSGFNFGLPISLNVGAGGAGGGG